MATTVTRYVNPDSTTGGNGTTASTTSSDPNRAFKYLSEWNTARARDLVAADEIEEVICATGGGATDNGVNIQTSNGWVTDSTHYIKITATPTQKFNNHYDTAKFRIYANGGNGFGGIAVNGPFVRIDGLQIVVHTYSQACVNISSPTVTVSNCYMTMVKVNAGTYLGVNVSIAGGGSNRPVIYNNVISDIDTGINHNSIDLAVPVYNNTIRNCNIGIDGNFQAQLVLKNNLVQNCTTACYYDVFHADSEYNVCDDNTGPATNRINGNVKFMSFFFWKPELANDDTVARGAGVNLSTDPDGYFSFNTDSINATRGSTWDIGASFNPNPGVRIRYVNPHSTGGDGTTSALTGANAAYASLNTCLDTERSDLVSANVVLDILCATQGNADTPVNQNTVAGWVTDIYRYVRIRAAPGHEASTEWSNTKYRIASPDGSSISAMSLVGGSGGPMFARVERIQGEYDCTGDVAGDGVRVFAGSPVVGTNGSGDIRWIGNHLRVIGTSLVVFNTYFNAIFANPGNSGTLERPFIYVINNILSNEATTSGYSSVNAAACRLEHRKHFGIFINNTVRGSWPYAFSGGDNATRYHYAYNNLANGITSALVSGTYVNTMCNYNASSHATLGYTAGANDRVSQTFTFISATNYRITASDTGAKGYGTALTLFTTDIDGNTRTVPWDIGASVYYAPITTTKMNLLFL
jgi:hypothetical protein